MFAKKFLSFLYMHLPLAYGIRPSVYPRANMTVLLPCDTGTECCANMQRLDPIVWHEMDKRVGNLSIEHVYSIVEYFSYNLWQWRRRPKPSEYMFEIAAVGNYSLEASGFGRQGYNETATKKEFRNPIYGIPKNLNQGMKLVTKYWSQFARGPQRGDDMDVEFLDYLGAEDYYPRGDTRPFFPYENPFNEYDPISATWNKGEKEEEFNWPATVEFSPDYYVTAFDAQFTEMRGVAKFACMDTREEWAIPEDEVKEERWFYMDCQDQSTLVILPKRIPFRNIGTPKEEWKVIMQPSCYSIVPEAVAAIMIPIAMKSCLFWSIAYPFVLMTIGSWRNLIQTTLIQWLWDPSAYTLGQVPFRRVVLSWVSYYVGVDLWPKFTLDTTYELYKYTKDAGYLPKPPDAPPIRKPMKLADARKDPHQKYTKDDYIDSIFVEEGREALSGNTLELAQQPPRMSYEEMLIEYSFYKYGNDDQLLDLGHHRPEEAIPGVEGIQFPLPVGFPDRVFFDRYARGENRTQVAEDVTFIRKDKEKAKIGYHHLPYAHQAVIDHPDRFGRYMSCGYAPNVGDGITLNMASIIVEDSD